MGFGITIHLGGDKSDKSQKIETPIQNSYSFWYMKRNTGGAKNANVSTRVYYCA
jgi:hypothetical protein